MKCWIRQGLINNRNACRHVLYTLSAVSVSPAVVSVSPAVATTNAEVFRYEILYFVFFMLRTRISHKKCRRRLLVAGTKAEMGSVAAPVGGSIVGSYERTEQRPHCLIICSLEATRLFSGLKAW